MKKVINIIFIVVSLLISTICLSGCMSEEEKLLTTPTEKYIIDGLKKVPGIIEIQAATEDNDPNGQMNKPKGYTAHVYFSYELVNQEEVYGDDLIDKGTDAGGSIEVYTTKEDAERRNDYLASFDGGTLASGSHKVIGTVVIRTSDELTASQQRLLESNIIASLTNKEDEIVDPFEEIRKLEKEQQDKAIQAILDFEKRILDEDWFLAPNFIIEDLDVNFSQEIIDYAMANCGLNWEEHAKRYAQPYLVYETYENQPGTPAYFCSPDMIEDMLVEDGYSSDIARKVVSNIDWEKQVEMYVQHLSDVYYDTFNRHEARIMLKKIVSEDSIDYILENSGIDWKKHALEIANWRWEEYSYNGTKDGAVEQIREYLKDLYQFKNDEIEYAIEHMSTDN